MMHDNSPYFPDQDDISATLFQRTEELNLIQNAKIDKKGEILLPVIILESPIVLPHMVSPVFISPGKNLDTLIKAQENHSTVVCMFEMEEKSSQYSNIGMEVAAGKLINLPDNNFSALVQGRRRVRIKELVNQGNQNLVRAEVIIEPEAEPDKSLFALIKTARTLFEQIVQLDRTIPPEAFIFSLNINEPGWLADAIATALSPSREKRLEILESLDVEKRLITVNQLLAEELEILELEEEIQNRIQNEVDRSQRENYLREQIKAIQVELGEADIWEQEIAEYKTTLQEKQYPEVVVETVENEIRKLSLNPSMSPETGIIRSYIDWCLHLPWNERTEDNLSVNHAEKILEKNHYGLDKAKERILEYLAVRSLVKDQTKQPVLCFVGPPGTGKTTLGQSISNALGRKFVRISLGGIRDEAEIRGHRRTYIGAMPGRILQTMKRAGTINPLFMLDEIDKVGNDFRGDPSAALLEVLDPENNHSFSDHYLEIPYDLSDVMFITTANTTENIPPALLDRMEVIEFPGYIDEDKLEIAKKFLIPKQRQENGLENEEISFDREAIELIIRDYTYEAGVRNLEREIGKICRKSAKKKSQKKKFEKSISTKIVEKYLGPPQFLSFIADTEDTVGTSTAVAWTENGGEIMPVEVLIMEGKGNLQITGKVGDIMQESAQAALSYIRARADEFEVDNEIFEKIDIHVHIPEGAIEKDGPSAGITICTAILSSLTDKKVRMDVGMTGELTLRGNILQVGGLREKIYAAHRAGLKTLIIPCKNKGELSEIPAYVKKDIKIICADHMDKVIKIALHPD